MTKTLAVILAKPENEIARLISNLERLHGHRSYDVRLMANHLHKINAKLTQLGLDPNDTTGPELYQALLGRFDKDSRKIDQALGVNSQTSAQERLQLAVEFAQQLLGPGEVWALKRTVAKTLLKQQPPKKLMKLLGYRTLDSMLKRQNIASLYLSVGYVESSSWQKNLRAKIIKLGQDNFEMRSPEIVFLPAKTWAAVRGPNTHVAVSKLMGAVTVRSLTFTDIPVSTYVLFLLEGLNQIGALKTSHTLLNAHPALNFWADSWHLMATSDNRPVSLNLHDVAINHLLKASFDGRSLEHGRQALLSELASYYHKGADDIKVLAKSLQIELTDLMPLPSKLQPAVEYSVVE
ncbi:MAG: hypothetical protein WD877_02090 [Candidatus Saccharimonadales bacterium]